MSPLDRAAASQAERRFDELVEAAAEKGLPYFEADHEWEPDVEAEWMRDFGHTRGPCKPRARRN